MMLSTIRRALTPNATHDEDKSIVGLTADPSAQTSFLPDSSPLQLSQTSKSPKMAGHHDSSMPIHSGQNPPSMRIPSGQNLQDRGQNETNDSLLSPLTAGEPILKSHHGAFSLDGPSDDHLQSSSPGSYARGSLLPPAEPAPSTESSPWEQRTPTPGASHVSAGPTTGNPQQPSDGINENRLPSAEPAQSTSNRLPSAEPAQPTNESSSTMVTKTSGGLLPRRRNARRAEATPEAANVEPEQSAPAPAMPPPAKREREDDPPDTDTRAVKKQRVQSGKEKDYSVIVKQQGASKDQSSAEGESSNGEQGSTSSGKQRHAAKDEVPKRRGRPRKESATHDVKSSPTSPEATRPKRGRTKKAEEATQNVRSSPTSPEATRPKRSRAKKAEQATQNVKSSPTSAEAARPKRGRAKKAEEDTQNVKSSPTSAEATRPKRGRAKKAEEATQDAKSSPTSSEATRPKRGRPKKEAATQNVKYNPMSSGAPPPKRGRPAKATTSPSTADKPKKRGRPKKA